MKTPYKYLILFSLAATTLSGCSNNENEPGISGRKDYPDFTATIEGAKTRAFNQSWEKGDKIGISGAGRDNVCYQTTETTGAFTVETPGNQIYFQDDNEVTFTAYYPWNNQPGNITADTKAQLQQRNFDFLWAQASGKKDAPNVTFNFTHIMVKMSITVKPGTDISYDDIKTARLSLNGFRHTGYFNITEGKTDANGEKESWTFSASAPFNDADNTRTFSLIFFPQLHEEPVEFLAELQLPDNKICSLRAYIDFTGANGKEDGENARNEWIAGRQYNLSVTLNKTEITLNECVINPWTVVDAGEITVD